MDDKKYFWANIANLVKAGYRSNAFAPLVWFNSIIDPILLIPACIINGILSYILIGMLCIIILFSLIMYAILYKKDANLLQSEHFRIEDKKLDLIASKSNDITINPVDITLQQFLEENTGGKRDGK